MDNLKNLGVIDAKNEFNNIPMEFIVPKNTKVVFVNDFYTNEVQGGAELTTDVIMNASPHKIFKIHSLSLTHDFVEKNKDYYYVFGNFTMCPVDGIGAIVRNNVKYSVIEYDYKYCGFRSEVLHKKQTGHECDCHLRPSGMLVEKFYECAQRVFWMSEEQKEHFMTKIPSLLFSGGPEKHVVLSSCFDEETINYLLELRKERETKPKKPIKIWGIQASNNWIKGTENTIKYANSKKYAVKVLQPMQYKDFLKELAKVDGFIFHPEDKDTCPRIVIESAILGLELDLNENVQIKNDSWLNGSCDELVSYLRTRPELFWSNIEL